MKKKLLAALLALCLTLSAALPTAALELEDARKLLKSWYVDPIPEEILALDSLEEILEALNDPYTQYLGAEEYSSFQASVNGESVVGVGVSIQSNFNRGYTILSVLPGSPALEAGLEPGDRIVAVDGVTLSAGMNIQELIGGEEGTSVTITVVRQADGGTRVYEMNRRSVVVPIVTYEQVGNAGVIDCVSFGESTVPTVREALEKLDSQTAVWIMDLRSNPGGSSSSACDTVGLFSGDGLAVIFSDSFGNTEYGGTDVSDMTDKPLILLTSGYSASGAELLAGAIRDYRTGIAVGQRTFGKGIAQLLLDETNTQGLFDGDCLKVTIYRFYSPYGVTNHTIGVLPTLTISPENAEKAALLLSGQLPYNPKDYMKLELAGQTFAVDLKQAVKEENRAAFQELLEALPPSAKVYRRLKSDWEELTPANLAYTLGLKLQKRSFSDVGASPFCREIETLSAHYLLSGYGDGTFRPGESITRAEFCAMVAGALDLPEGSKSLFSDVPAGAWYAGAVSGMTSMGFLAGYEDGTFRPDNTITYEEMVTVLAGVTVWASVKGRYLAEQEVPIDEYPEYCQFSSWAQTPARVLNKLDALVGEQEPSAPGTRETAAGLLCTLMESIHLIWD